MGQNGTTEFIFAHHAEKVREENIYQEAPGYPMITRKGETQTREKTQMLVEVINKMPAESALILGGVSRAVRTKSTLAVFVDELRELLRDRIETREKGEIIFAKSRSERELTATADFLTGLRKKTCDTSNWIGCAATQ